MNRIKRRRIWRLPPVYHPVDTVDLERIRETISNLCGKLYHLNNPKMLPHDPLLTTHCLIAARKLSDLDRMLAETIKRMR